MNTNTSITDEQIKDLEKEVSVLRESLSELLGRLGPISTSQPLPGDEPPVGEAMIGSGAIPAPLPSLPDAIRCLRLAVSYQRQRVDYQLANLAI